MKTGTMLLLTILSLACCQTSAEDTTSQCRNLRGQFERCGPRQFCSHINSLDRGCRNCTEIYENWCSNEHINRFKKEYPSCAILCEEKKVADLNEQNEQLRQILQKTDHDMAKLKDELNATGMALRTSQEQNAIKDQKIQASEDHINVLKYILITVSIVTPLILLLLIFSIFKCSRLYWKTKDQHGCSEPASTAFEVESHNSASSLEERQPLRVFEPLAINQSPVVQSSDSGNSSEGNISHPTSSNSSLNNARAPTGGTDHHVNDNKDFTLTMPPYGSDDTVAKNPEAT